MKGTKRIFQWDVPFLELYINEKWNENVLNKMVVKENTKLKLE